MTRRSRQRLKAVLVTPAEEAAAAFRYARRGGLWFAGGALVTALTYAFSEGTYFLAWGPLIFGGFQLVRGLLRYLTVPNGGRQAAHLALLGGLIAVGVLSAGFVGLSESQAAQQAADRDQWNSMIDATSLDVAKASELVNGVANSPGPWNATDSADMAKASALVCGRRGGRCESGGPRAARLVSHGHGEELPRCRDDHPRLFLMSATSPATAFETLDNRWKSRLQEAMSLSDRFESQEGTTP